MKFRLLSVASQLFSKALRLHYSFFSGKILSVRAICVNEKNQVYLVRHSYTPGWHLPGGGVDNGVSVDEALLKELYEEGNLAVVNRPVLRRVYLNAKGSRREHIVLFTVQVVQQEAFSRSFEIMEGKFFSLGELPQELDSGCHRRILEWVVGEFLAREW